MVATRRAGSLQGPDPLSFTVPQEFRNTRLDRVITAVWAKMHPEAGVTRGMVQRWIDENRVLLNGKPGRVAQKVTAGMVVQVEPGPAPTTTAEPDASVKFSVIFEDEHLVVVDKPAGLVVHPARGNFTGTLVNGLLARGVLDNPSLHNPSAKPEYPRPGIVHRLDKGTSGVLVVAKDERTREGLKKLFSSHDIERSYLAITVGQTVPAMIRTLHGRHPVDRLRFTTHVTSGKTAITHVDPVELLANGRATLVRCTLETGRTHQIRVHLAEVQKTSLLGDPLYSKRLHDLALRALADALGHQALHAEVLGLVHPITKVRHRWTAPLPDDFAHALASLRGLRG